MSLKALIENQVRTNAMFGIKGQDWTYPPTAATAQEIFGRIDSNLSPEVIYMDGERKPAAARKFEKEQRTALAELKALGFAPIGQTYNI